MVNIEVIKVKSNQEKLSRLCQTIKNHFDQRMKILIAVPNDEIALYIDQLLWRLPPDSVLPHKIVKKESVDPVVITTSMENLNKANVLFNLLPGAHPLWRQFETVYELYDETDPAKEARSKERLAAYK